MIGLTMLVDDVADSSGKPVQQYVAPEQPVLPFDGRVGQNKTYQEKHGGEFVRNRLRASEGVPSDGSVGRKKTHDDDQQSRTNDKDPVDTFDPGLHYLSELLLHEFTSLLVV